MPEYLDGEMTIEQCERAYFDQITESDVRELIEMERSSDRSEIEWQRAVASSIAAPFKGSRIITEYFN